MLLRLQKDFIEHHIKCIHATFILAYERYNSVSDKVFILKKLKRAIIKAHDK